MSTWSALQYSLLALVAASGTAVVLTRDPRRQVFASATFALVQSVLYFVLHSPDVALSQIAVGTMILPALTLFTLARLEGRKR